MKSLPSRQRGAALIVSLIMLMLITMLAVTSFRLGKSNLQIVGNMQQRANALSGAQGSIEAVISTIQFTQTPMSAIPTPCGGTQNTVCLDVNGDGVTDVNITVTPNCLTHYVIPNMQLDFTNANDVGCLLGISQTYGTVGASNGTSLCANTLWDQQAVATDAVTSAQYVINEGIAVRVVASQSNAYCP